MNEALPTSKDSFFLLWILN